MEKTRKIIQDNIHSFPEFSYYLSIVNKIEENVQIMPDVSIETSKALLEGVSKTLLKNLDSAYVESINDKPSDLVKRVLEKMSRYVEIDVGVLRAASSFIHRVTEIRNSSGDISHGKAVPKLISSNIDHAKIIAHITDGTIEFILNLYFQMKWQSVEILIYEENELFNEYLDSQYQFEEIKYSKALFDQDLVVYKDKLNRYNIENDIEN